MNKTTTKRPVRRKQRLSAIMRANRLRTGKTLDDMVAMTKLGKSTLWELENDYQIDPRLSTLQAVCKAYGFSISRIKERG